MKVDDVLPNEVNDCAVRLLPDLISCEELPLTIVSCACDVAYRRIQPYVEVFILLTRDFKPKVRSIPTNAPVIQSLFDPVENLVPDLWLKVTVVFQPSLELVAEGAQPEEVMVTPSPYRQVTADATVGLDEVGGGVGSIAFLTDITVLVLGTALWASPLNIPVWQVSLAMFAVSEFYLLRVDVTILPKAFEDQQPLQQILSR